MALKTDHQTGESIKAADMNSQASAIIENSHNILSLFLEDYFAGKFPNSTGLFFDGFSDETKADILTNLSIDTGAQILKFGVGTFGSGADGAITVSGTTKVDTSKEAVTLAASSGQKDIEVANGGTFTVGKKVLIHQTQGTGAGNYEFAQIDSISTNTLTMVDNLGLSYDATGAQIIQLFEYTNVTVQNGGLIDADAWNGTVGGIVVFLANGTVTVESGGSISAGSLGFRGGAKADTAQAQQGESSLGVGIASASPNGEAGGGGTALSGGCKGAGGGGSYGTVGIAGGSNGGCAGGAPGATIGAATLALLFFGGAGGGGSDNAAGATSGDGGRSGGIVLVVCNIIDVQTGGAVDSDGQNGFAGTNPASSGGGGAGAGGSVLLLSDDITLGTALVTANSATGAQSFGGNSGVGRIAVNSDPSILTGTSSPANGTDGAVVGLFPDFTSGVYESIVTAFQQAKSETRCWITRTFNTQFNLDSGIGIGASTLTILGLHTSLFSIGDTIDISNATNTIRERVTLTLVAFGGGVTTLTFTPVTVNAFDTSAFVERVDVIPRLSLVDSGDTASFQTLTYVRSIVDFTNGLVEDEYTLSTTAEEDLKVELAFTRNNTSVEVEASLLGVSLYI